MSLDLRQLIGKLGETPKRALEGAVGLAVSKTHDEVELEHWMIKLLEVDDSDIPQVLRRFEVDPEHLLAALRQELEGYRTGHRQNPQLTETILLLGRESWVWCSINYGLAQIRSGGILIAVLEEPELYRRMLSVFPPIARVNVETLKQDFVALVGGSIEDREARAARGTDGGPSEVNPGGSSRAPGLDQYTVDLTSEAEAGRIDPVLGREPEVRQIVDILMRRRQNNPILTGEAGVGKTAVVEGLALRISQGDVPVSLQGVRLRTLDLGLLQAGAGVKGEFENRLKQVIDEVKRSPEPIILFIDEAHTLIGAGGQEGQNDAANLLKPALARGELRTIGATTWSEYKKYFEKDPALTRRFQPVKVDEPDEATAIRMMRGVAEKFEEHHGVTILDEAIEDSVRLSARYVPARQLPDKSVSVLDTACARVGVGVGAVPGVIEDLRRQLDALEAERRRLDKEQSLGEDHAERLDAIELARGEAHAMLGELESRWESEKQGVERVRALRRNLAEGKNGKPASGADAKKLRIELAAEREALAALQGEDPLVLMDVDGQAIAEVISSQTGIPVGRMLADEIHSVLELRDTLKGRVLGQDHGLEAIARRIHTSRANLDNPNKPIGVFMLVGPSGVGKTETAMALAETLYGGERNAIVINMSEYQESHTVSSLKGAPPGYVGYGEGGVLTEAVRRRPYSVVLLDEVEKAHPDVMELFFQVFDKGVLEDGEGREIDFKNTVILLTSNVGSDTIMGLSADPETRPEPGTMVEAIRPELLSAFPAALLGRLVTVPYYPVTGDVLASIVRLQVGRIERRVRENHGAEFVYGDDLIESVVARCSEVESGGRAVDNILTHSMLPQLSAEVLTRMAESRPFTKVEVSAAEDGEFRFVIS